VSEQAVEDAQAPVAEATIAENGSSNGATAVNGVIEELPSIALPPRFEFNQVDQVHDASAAAVPVPALGAIAAFKGTFAGKGFNTIFRPHEPGSDNILELNLTREELTFSPRLGTVPNRGFVQKDVFLNGVPYLQTISDVTSGVPVGIHVEPGLWMAVPSTVDPAEAKTYARMASIPHGTTINAQGTAKEITGPPTIPAVDITPFVSSSHQLIGFPSQNAGAPSPDRIPQNLAGTGITQAMLDDPNSVLRHHIAGQHIVSTTIISISTSPHTPLFGGGSENIAFLLGFPGAQHNPNATGQNAQAVVMHATFWIETVEHTIHVPPIPAPLKKSGTALEVKPQAQVEGGPLPTFAIEPPHPETSAQHTITVKTHQIQYSQTVILNFNGLSWPHVSVATLVPAHPIHVKHTP
jgi:hypothetical protein